MGPISFWTQKREKEVSSFRESKHDSSAAQPATQSLSGYKLVDVS